MEIKGKVGVITGGSSGIGRTTAERLAKEGAAIVVATSPRAKKTSAPAPAVTPIIKLLVALETLSGRCMT